jgi:hypothetical protein
MTAMTTETLVTTPLIVSERNPRYFGAQGPDGETRIVYLTGAHVNNNFHDGMGMGPDCPDEPDRFDFDAYLDWLVDHGHNFIRLWRWEQFKSQVGGGAVHACMSPQPWARTGPGEATDGKPKFDLSNFDDEHFRRLRERVEKASQRGIYVDVMLFEGFGLHLTPPPDNVEGHPFHAKSNVNGIGIESIVDYMTLPLDPQIQELQEAYIGKVLDTVHGLPNVLYEVANEASGQDAESTEMPGMPPIPGRIGDTTTWQYWVIETVKRLERERGYDARPIGMTMQFPVADMRKTNEPLFASPADWISPGFDEPFDPNADMSAGPPPSHWYTDPPQADGRKVIIADTDHFSPMAADAVWPWKAFTRGHNPILYDLGIIGGVNPDDPSAGFPSYESLEDARLALGDTRRLADRVDLARLVPDSTASSTRYALAAEGQEYVVFQPDAGAFSVTLPQGTYAAEWFSLADRTWTDADAVSTDGAEGTSFDSPSSGPGVMHLRRMDE